MFGATCPAGIFAPMNINQPILFRRSGRLVDLEEVSKTVLQYEKISFDFCCAWAYPPSWPGNPPGYCHIRKPYGGTAVYLAVDSVARGAPLGGDTTLHPLYQSTSYKNCNWILPDCSIDHFFMACLHHTVSNLKKYESTSSVILNASNIKHLKKKINLS